MKAMKLLVVGVAVCLSASVAGADDKKGDNAKLIVGKWEVTAAHEGGPPKGGTVEFTKDGKFTISGDQDGMKLRIEGTYKVDGNKLALKFKMGDNEGAVEVTIEKLDDKTMVSSSEHGKVELKRKT
jgi:uncharacterized protein (TIGR03066 family)